MSRALHLNPGPLKFLYDGCEVSAGPSFLNSDLPDFSIVPSLFWCSPSHLLMQSYPIIESVLPILSRTFRVLTQSFCFFFDLDLLPFDAVLPTSRVSPSFFWVGPSVFWLSLSGFFLVFFWVGPSLFWRSPTHLLSQSFPFLSRTFRALTQSFCFFVFFFELDLLSFDAVLPIYWVSASHFWVGPSVFWLRFSVLYFFWVGSSLFWRSPTHLLSQSFPFLSRTFLF